MLDGRFDYRRRGARARPRRAVPRTSSRSRCGRSSRPRASIRRALTPGLRRDADELEGFLEFLVGEVHDDALARPSSRGRSRTRRSACLPGDPRRPPLATPAGCSSTRWAWRRSAASSAQLHPRLRGRPAARRGARPRRRPDARARPRRPSSRRPTRDACSATSTSGCGMLEERRDAPAAELLHAVAVPPRRPRRPHRRGGRALPREPARRRRRHAAGA